MAQTVLPEPLPVFPDTSPASGTASPQGACEDAAEQTERRRWTDNGASDKQAILDELQRRLMRGIVDEADVRVERKMKEMWSRGNKMLKQLEQESHQQTANFSAELARVRKKQDAMDAEHKHLESVVAGMVHQLTMLGTLFSAPPAAATPQAAPPTPSPPTPAAPPGLLAATPSKAPPGLLAPGSASSTAASSDPAASASATEDSSSEPAAGSTPASFPSLPTVPDFPFSPLPPAGVAPAMPLSLAEAIGADSPKPQASLAGALPSTPEGAPLPAGGFEKVFSFTLRRADGTDLGLNVSHHVKDKALRVEGVRPEGAVEAWNRACIGSTVAEKALRPGDRIVSVNSVMYDPAKMLEECRDRQLLKLTVVRGQAPLPEAPAAPKGSPLRADASEFVPTGAPGLAVEQPKKEDARPVECQDDTKQAAEDLPESVPE